MKYLESRKAKVLLLSGYRETQWEKNRRVNIVKNDVLVTRTIFFPSELSVSEKTRVKYPSSGATKALHGGIAKGGWFCFLLISS